MRVFTPDEVATGTESKYLGVLVAAKYSRELNTLPSEAMPLGEEKTVTCRGWSQTKTHVRDSWISWRKHTPPPRAR